MFGVSSIQMTMDHYKHERLPMIPPHSLYPKGICLSDQNADLQQITGKLNCPPNSARKEDTMLHDFIQLNFTTILSCLFLSVFILTNHLFSWKVIRLFWVTIGCTIALVAADSLELWAATWTHPSQFRVLMSAIGYSLRPLGAFCLICILERDSESTKKWLPIPFAVNVVCVFSALFTPVVFSYTSDNIFVRGPLGAVPFLVSGIYLIAMVFFTVKKYNEGNHTESLIAFFISISLAVSSIAESVYHFDGFLNASSSLSVIFYYLYLHTQQFRRDPLTNLLNRRCFYLDAEAHLNCTFALISIDLNNLKQINDNQGHAAGDQAICITVACIRRNLPHGYQFYRIGGDEFMILAYKQTPSQIDAVILAVRKELETTPYSCAIGTVFYNPGDDFEQTVVLADTEMYQDKRKIKKQLKEAGACYNRATSS